MITRGATHIKGRTFSSVVLQPSVNSVARDTGFCGRSSKVVLGNTQTILIWLDRIGVITAVSKTENTGSNPVQATKKVL